MSLGVWQIVIIAVLVVLLFGRGKISELMGDVAKGIKSFKKGMADEPAEPRTINQNSEAQAGSTDSVNRDPARNA